MAVYIELPDMVGYLTQFRDIDPDNPDLETLDDCLNRAEGFINSYIGTRTSLAAAASATRTVYGNGLQILPLPMYTAGSVTSVTTISGSTVPDYIEQDNHLVITDSSGVVLTPWRAGIAHASGSATVWTRGLPYTVTATFGWNTSDLAVLAEATLQIAVQLWRFKDSGGSETIGSEGAITTVRAGWTPLVKLGLDDIERRVRGVSAGIH